MEVLVAVASVVATLPVASWLRGLWRRGPGARRDYRRRVEQLSVGITAARCEEIIGMGSPTHAGTLLREDGSAFFARLFATEWCTVELITDIDGVVRRFSVWSRHKKFRPTFRAGGQWPRLDITMRTTTLDQMGKPTRVNAYVGAQTAAYLEQHYYGRPGDYRWYHAGFNETAMALDAKLPDRLHDVLKPYNLEWPDEDTLPPEIEDFRRQNRLCVYGEADEQWLTFEFSIAPSMVQTWALRRRVTWVTRWKERRIVRRSAKELPAGD